MKQRFILLVTISFILTYFSCKHLPDLTLFNPLGGVDTSVTIVPCSKDSVYFNRDIYPLITSNCAMTGGCHDAISHKEGVVLTDYDNIIATGGIKPFNPNNSKLYTITKETNPKDIMPPPPKSLTAAQLELVRKWILQGAKNNYCFECDSTAIKFAANILPLIQANCTSCHNTATPSGNVYLRDYADVKNALIGNKLQNSINYTYTELEVKKNMPPAKKLPSCKIDNITKWIANGALNN